MRREAAMSSWPLFCGIVSLLTVSIHSTKPLPATSQEVAAEKTDAVLQRAIEYNADEAASRFPEDSGSNERSLQEILSFDSELRDGGRNALPVLNPADDDDEEEDSGDSGSQLHSTGVKRRWGDASLQLWRKRNFEVLTGLDRSRNVSVQDTKGAELHNLGVAGKQLVEEDQEPNEQPDSPKESSFADDSSENEPSTKSDGSHKRKWGDNSMTVWGKRTAYGKRKWADNTVTSWGRGEDGSLEQPVKRRWGDNSMTAWGKRASDEKRKWGDSSLTAWGKRQSDDKRKWGDNSMSIWGKRLSDYKRKWGDNTMSIWGKRQADDKRKWGDNSMSIWGKRQAGDKRKWGDNSMSIWGKRQTDDKRKWGDNSMSIWGKRQADDKRKWGDNSMSIWGKRQADDKRKWGDTNSMSIWGKRQADDKRKWGDNSMSIWGKRQADDKRKWGDNSMSIWGKRQADDKRKWGDNSMSIWGKRQADNKRKWGDNSMSIWGKREGGAYQDELAQQKWRDNSMTPWGKKRTHFASGPTGDPSKASLCAWLQRISEDKIQPLRNGCEESPAGKNDASLTADTLFANDPVADTHQTTRDVSIDRRNSLVPAGQQRHPTTGKNSEGTPSNRKSIAKRSVSATPDVLSGAWSKRLRNRGWGFWGAYVNPYGGPKRNWETNTMKVWGKRRDDVNDREAEEYTDWATTSAARDDGVWKRIWTSDNSLRIWGR